MFTAKFKNSDFKNRQDSEVVPLRWATLRIVNHFQPRLLELWREGQLDTKLFNIVSGDIKPTSAGWKAIETLVWHLKLDVSIGYTVTETIVEIFPSICPEMRQ